MRKWFVLALLICGPLPTLFYGFRAFSQLQHLSFLGQETERIKTKALQARKLHEKEEAHLAPLKQSDPHYLDKYVETLRFLLPEVKKLETVAQDNLENENLVKKLQFLKSNQNQLLFSEQNMRSHELFKEVEEIQQHPVEMNEEDLKRLLCLIEGITIWPYGPQEGRPLFIITDFKLSKKEMFGKEKVYSVSMKLLKRENL